MVCAEPCLAQSSNPPSITDPTSALDQQLFGQEMYRLPPVQSGTTFQLNETPTSSIGSVATPAPLTVPPAETFPAPPAPEKVPTPSANIPLALPGISLLDGSGIPPKPKEEKLWEGNFSLGLDGSEGNTNTSNFQCGFQAKRKTEQTVLSLSADYLRQSTELINTVNRLYSEGRYEWLLKDSRWSCYVHETVEYDEFQAYDVCDTADTGLGYRLLKNDKTTLIGRVGAGYSHYYGGPDSGRYFPETVYSLSLEQQITKRQKFLGRVEYAPDVTQFARYRLRVQAALESALDDANHLSLKLGMLERYTSLQDEAALPNDFDYAAMVMWKF